MKFAWIAAAGLLAIGAPAIAHDAPPPQPVAVAPAQGPVDPERLALAQELLGQLDVKAMLHKMFSGMTANIRAPAGATPDQQARIQQLISSMGAGYDAIIPDLMDKVTDLYARNFTAQEMRDSLAFYRTPSGQTMLKKMPLMMAQLQPLSYAIVPKMFDKMQADYCAHRTCDATDEIMFAAMKSSVKTPH